MLISKERSREFRNFLRWLLEDIYADRDHVYVFLGNCSTRT